MCGVIAYVGLPNSPATATYLTEEEREWAVQRLELKGSSAERYSSRCLFIVVYKALTNMRLERDKKPSAGLKFDEASSTSKSGSVPLPILPFCPAYTHLAFSYGSSNS